MRQANEISHESLSLEECERLVLSPPAVPFNPTELVRYFSNRLTASAKHSLHSLNTDDGKPVHRRNASVSWCRSEYDNKFKKFDSCPKSSTRRPNQNVFGEQPNLEPQNVLHPTKTPISPQLQSVKSSKKNLYISSPYAWRYLFCCVSKNNQSPKSPDNRNLEANGNELLPIKTSELRESRIKVEKIFREPTEKPPPKAIVKQSKKGQFQAFFRRRPQDPSVVLCLVTKLQSPQSSQSLLMRTALPTLTVSALEDSPSIISPIQRIDYLPSTKEFLPTNKRQTDGVISNIPNDDEPLDSHENHDLNYISTDTTSDESNHTEDSFSDHYEQPTSPGNDLLGTPSDECFGKKCLILDLDETLVHSSFKHVDNADFSVIVEIENIQHEVLVCKRPHLEKFIEAIGPLFECVVFTASLSKYADPVCDKIDFYGHFKHRLFREACVCFKNNYIKHLDVLGRDLDQICIIDNSPISFYFHRQNAIQIISWFDDPDDTALLDLIPYLTELAAASSVTEYLQSFVPPRSAVCPQNDLASWLLMQPNDVNCGFYEADDDEESKPTMYGDTSLIHCQNNALTIACHSAALPS